MFLDRQRAAMEVNVEATRFVEAGIGNVKEALLGKERIFSIELPLVDGPKLARILIVVLFVQIISKKMIKHFQGKIVAAIVPSFCIGELSDTGAWRIELFIR